MFSNRLTRTFRSTGFRLAAITTSLFIVSYLVVFAVIFWVATNALESQRRGAIEQELATMKFQLEHGGLAALKLAIHAENSVASGFPVFALLEEPNGSIFGNISPLHIKMGWNDYSGANIKSPSLEDVDERILTGFGLKLLDGSLLLVGFDRFNIIETQEAIVAAFGWSAFAMLFFAVGGGVLIGRRALYRIDAFNNRLHAFAEGKLEERLNISGSGDELDELARGINVTLERVEELMSSLQQVSSDIAHDLRTPLTRLRQRLEEASLDVKSPAVFASVLDDAREKVDEILATFSALLGIAQIEAGALRNKFTTVQLSELCHSVVEAYRATFEDEARSISVEIVPNVTILGDRNLITQMLVNLIENVLRHTPLGTPMNFSLGTNGSTVILKVADKGPGIPKPEQEKIFRRFYRLERSRTTPGNGLGLTLVHAVAGLHSADIGFGVAGDGLEISIEFLIQPYVRRLEQI
ncbi:MAG: ATP-binding protein [Parvibaculaceae bacterium]